MRFRPALALPPLLALAAHVVPFPALAQDTPVEEAAPVEEDEAGGAAASTSTPEPGPREAMEPFTEEQTAWIEKKLASRRSYTLGFDVFMKGLYKNDQSNGSVWLGNPHPEGDNYSGNNGVAGVLGIRIDGRVRPNLTAGARLETRFGQLFADFYENGDRAVDENGRPARVDATGESLGLNHAAYAQLRGLYIQWDAPTPIPTIKSMRAGSSDLSLWNPWTIGKIRFIDRDNAKGFFFVGEVPGASNLVPPKLEYNLARIALPKLYASAGFNTGIADPLVENPFWARDAAYVGMLRVRPTHSFDVTVIGSVLLDEEADLDDPDALGSTNLLDERDGVVTTVPRYTNWNATLDMGWRPAKNMSASLLVGGSRSDPDLGLVFNTIDNNQGLSPIPLATVNGYAVRARFEATELPGGLGLSAEYFNIGEDWVATMGTRREEDVLITEGFLDGQLPTLNIANEFIDFTEPFYESIVGWHGATLKPRLALGPVALEVEGTYIFYNTNAQDRCTSRTVPGCDAGGVYPDFLFPDGMTDTDFFTFANTNDRGRDPRAVYKQNQERQTIIAAARARFVGWSEHVAIEGLGKYIYDQDLRDTDFEGEDDYLGNLVTAQLKASIKVNARFTVGAGGKLDLWDEENRSGSVVAGVPRYHDYSTVKSKLWIEGRFDIPGDIIGNAFFSYRAELLNKDVDASDDVLDFEYRNVVRSLAMLYAGF